MKVDKQTEKDITEVVNLYRQIKMTAEDATDFLVLVGSAGVVGIMFYIVKTFADVLIELKLPETPVRLLSLVLFMGGIIMVILTASATKKKIKRRL